MTRLGILASGRGSNFCAIADACRHGELDASPAVVISDRRDAPVLDEARRRDIPAHHIPFEDATEFETRAIDLLRNHGCALILLAGFMRILSPRFVDAFSPRVLNIHPSLLPRFPGLHAPRQALEAGANVTGCTVHVVTAEVDAGPIVDQIEVPVRPDDTEETLARRILTREHELYPRAIERYLRTWM